ncbi:MAG: mechanosensitive ion channel family protein [Leptolyngbyaceae bacterium]|nr:mechanosensitive ion channel family protein [Leptolyngbyaceae bacterium]
MNTEFLSNELLGNTLGDYLLAIATFVIAVIVIRIVKSIVVGRLKRWSRYTSTDLDDRLITIVERPLIALLYLGAFYIAIRNLDLHPILQQSIDVICVIIGTLLAVQLLGSLVEYGARLYLLKKRSDPAMTQTVDAVVPAIKVVVWAIGIVFLLDNLGFDISAVVTGLGIGGVAVALAAQGILGDLFSYISILSDRPFELGDFIIVGDLVGTVEHIGLKTTRLRSLTGEELIIANTDITSSRIQNFKRMARRRIAFSIGVTYETAADTLKQIPSLIQQVIEGVKPVTFDRAHFASYGDFSLNYEVVYYVETSDYGEYMDAQQTIYFGIRDVFEEKGIEFAYPTQLLYVNGLTAEAKGQNTDDGQRLAVTHNSSGN